MKKCAQIGMVSGMRAFAVPGVSSQLNPKSYFGADRNLWTSLMILEWIQDQWPDAPNRTDTLPLIFRMLSGAAVAMVTKENKKKSLMLAGIVGAGSAYLGTQISFRIRKYFADEWKIPQTFLGSLEDVISVWIASQLVTQEKNSAVS